MKTLIALQSRLLVPPPKATTSSLQQVAVLDRVSGFVPGFVPCRCSHPSLRSISGSNSQASTQWSCAAASLNHPCVSVSSPLAASFRRKSPATCARMSSSAPSSWRSRCGFPRQRLGDRLEHRVDRTLGRDPAHPHPARHTADDVRLVHPLTHVRPVSRSTSASDIRTGGLRPRSVIAA